MTLHGASGAGTFRIGSVIGRGISIYFGNFLSFAILSVVAFLPLFVVGAVFGAAILDIEAMSKSDWTPDGGFVAGIILAVVALVIGWNWLSAGVTYGVISAMRQGSVNLGEAMTTSLRSVLPLIGLGALAVVFFVLMGLVMLIPILGFFVFMGVAGYLVVRWWVVIPAIVVEQIGPIAGLRRAAELTKGNRWSILGAIALWVVVSMVAMMILQMVLAVVLGTPMDFEAGMAAEASGGAVDWVVQIVVGLVDLVFVGLGASVVAVGYHDLRIATEGGSSEQMARSFN